MNKITSKILSVMLILVLTIANSGLVLSYIIGNNVSYAVNENIELQSKATNNRNVEFDAFFIDSNNAIKHKSELNVLEKQKIYASIDVKNVGYIKDGYIEFTNSKGGSELSYMLSIENNNNSKLQKVERYKVELKQINVGNFIAEIVVESNIGNKMPLEFLSQESKVIFKGVYVDANGKENNIEKEIKLQTDLKSGYTAKVEANLTNYQTYETLTGVNIIEVKQEIRGTKRAKRVTSRKNNNRNNCPRNRWKKSNRCDSYCKRVRIHKWTKRREGSVWKR